MPVATTNHDAETMPAASAAAAAAVTGYSGSVSSAKNALGALNINPRPVIEEALAPENVVQCIDHRPMQATSPSATPVDTRPNPPLRLWLENAHCQVSQTPVPFSRCSSFIDLHPSPLPLPDRLADYLLDIMSSSAGKVLLYN